MLSNIRVCVFISDAFRGHNILATRNSNEKRDSPTSTGEDTSQQQRDTKQKVVKESTTTFQLTTNRTRLLLNNYKVSNCTNDGACRIADI